MTLSVLTIVKNRAGHLAQLVEGLRRGILLPDELIVVDMASDPPIRIEETPFPNRVLRLERGGLPLAAARNAAAAAAESDRLLFLDVDCIPMSALAGEMAASLAEHDALICAEVLYLGPDDARGTWTEAGLKAHARPHEARSFPAIGLREEANAGLFWSLAFGINRRRWLDLGGFDEAFEGYGAEDTDFGFRAARSGLPLLFKGGAGAFHQYHDVLDPPLQHLDDIVRNAMTFRRRWQRWPMEGWLAAFERAGLISIEGNMIAKLRSPAASEIEQALNGQTGRTVVSAAASTRAEPSRSHG